MPRQVHKRLVLILAVILAGNIGVSLAKQRRQSQLSLFQKEWLAQKDWYLGKIIELAGTSAHTLADDYGRWDELVDWLSKPDTTWADENLASGLECFKSDVLAVFALDGRCVYVASEAGRGKLEEWLPAPSAAVRDRIRREGNVCYFAWGPHGLLEIHASTVVPSADPGRRTAARGLILAGRLWDDDYLEQLSELVDGRLGVIAGSHRLAVQPAEVSQLLKCVRELTDGDGNPIASVEATFESGLIHTLRSYTVTDALEQIGLLVALIPLLYVPLVNWVARPLRLLARGMERRDPAMLATLERSRTEFGELATLVRESVEHEAALQKEVDERRLAERQLVRALRAAEAAARAKSEFLANMSHEIRTPMNGVLGMTALLLDTPMDEQQAEYADTIRQSSEALLAVVNDVLDLAKLEAGKLQIDVGDFAPAELLRVAVEGQAAKARGNGIDLIVDERRVAPVRLNGDAARLQQVLNHLVGNAVKFTPTGHVLVELIVEPLRHGRAGLELIVSDSGIGIPEDRREAIFDAFMQADGSATRRFGGTGVGLAICRQLAELMGGSLTVASQVGQGSCFRFRVELPVAACGAIFAVLPPPSLGRVLVVDDHEVQQSVLVQQLGAWGVEADDVDSPAEALRVLHRWSGDGRGLACILLDGGLAGIDPRAAIRRLRAEPLAADCPIVLMGGESQPLGGEFGRLAFVPKPVFAEALATALGGSARAAGPPESADSEAQPSDAGPPPEPEGRLHGARVLLVEDTVLNQKVARRMLEKLGCDVAVANHGVEALEALEQAPFDVVLMDCQMPEMDGYTATREIRAAEQGGPGHLPVIALTAHALAGDREACLAAGMDDYLTKPLAIEALREALVSWVPQADRNGNGRHADPPAAPENPEVNAATVS